MSAATDVRRRAREDGRRAESVVADYLFAAGFGILARNLRLGRLEIDVVARDRGLVAIVEVRTRGRGAYVTALASVDRAKRDRLRRAAAELWRTRLVGAADVERVRIDVAAVTFEGSSSRLEYIEGAIS